QDPHEDLVVRAAEAVGDVTLDEPHGTGPGFPHLPQRGVTAPPFSGNRASGQRTSVRSTPPAGAALLRRRAYPTMTASRAAAVSRSSSGCTRGASARTGTARRASPRR